MEELVPNELSRDTYASHDVSMEVVKFDDAHATVLGPEELNVNTAPFARDVLNKLLYDRDIKRIDFDSSRSEHIDSTGLGVLIGAFKRGKRENKELRIVNANNKAMRLLEITGLAKVITIIQAPEQSA